mgnify:CR=1
MDTKGALTITGLSLDLLGAFLLSVPLVWDIDALIKFTDAQASVIRKGLLRTMREGGASRHVVIWATGSLFVLGLAAGGGLAYVLYPQLSRWGTEGLLPTIIGMVVGSLVSLITLAAMAGVLSIWLRWVQKGQHERRVGQVGLFVLCLGFVCQAIVNLL